MTGKEIIERHESEQANGGSGCFTFIMAVMFSFFILVRMIDKFVIPYVECRGKTTQTCNEFHKTWEYDLFARTVTTYSQEQSK